MEILKCEATYNREEYKTLAGAAFKWANFQISDAEHTFTTPVSGTVKEVKYIKGDTMVRFLMFDRHKPEEGSYLFQYHVYTMTEEDIQEELKKHEKKIADSQLKKEEPVKKIKKETVKTKPVEQPIMVEEVESTDEILEPNQDVETSLQANEEEQAQKTLDAWTAAMSMDNEEEEGELTGQASQEELEANGQESLALF